ncbi:hypothetical protein TD95_003753 [Thielaviopsis punctulata]|uniref:Endoplasmic reticulum lectin n=1 Tax=Thielaviopsis punctulata TaxID=72032 RepID=A0A0F4Z784_9PEZI|nr:hypothetical protein TD95_003753 [Thielaviopsis punctulata]
MGILLYDIVFDNAWILPEDAQALLDKQAGAPAPSANAVPGSDVVPTSGSDAAKDAGSGSGKPDVPETYFLMNVPPSKYLCFIPTIESKSAENATAAELARENEAKELSRASETGWSILKSMDGECLYFMSGWWSYKYCYDSYIVQFHAQPAMPGQAPPVPDPHMAAYVLGRASKVHHEDGNWLDEEWQKGAEDVKSSTTDIQVKGDQRFLVHRLTGGTMCDLTNRERTIEIQYHCAPGATHDSIAWIKEVTTCAYLMVVNTPRLCKDAAFLPQKEDAANVIDCREILPAEYAAEDGDEWFAKRKAEEAKRREEDTKGLFTIKPAPEPIKTQITGKDGTEYHVVVGLDQDEIKDLSPEEMVALAQQRAAESLADKPPAAGGKPAAAAAKNKPATPAADDDVKQALRDAMDQYYGTGALSDDEYAALFDEAANAAEMLAYEEEDFEADVQAILDIYQEMARGYIKAGKKLPEWLRKHLDTLRGTLAESPEKAELFEAYSRVRNGQYKKTQGKKEEATGRYEGAGDATGSEEEFFQKKDEL